MRLEEIGNVSKRIISDYGAAKYDQVYLAYAKFVSVLKSEPKLIQLLPLDQGDDAAKGAKTPYQFERKPKSCSTRCCPNTWRS